MSGPAMMRRLQQAGAVTFEQNADYSDRADLIIGGEAVGTVVSAPSDLDTFYVLVSAYLVRARSLAAAQRSARAHKIRVTGVCVLASAAGPRWKRARPLQGAPAHPLARASIGAVLAACDAHPAEDV